MSSYGTLRSIQSIGIVYSCVARGKVVLAYSANCHGNFSEVVPGVLAVIPTNVDDRMTYTSGDYMFHYNTSKRGIIILCITDDDFERSRAFMFLEDAKEKFLSTYSDSNITRFTPFSLNSTFGEYLKTSMEEYSDSSYLNMESDETNRIRLDTISVQEFTDYESSGQLEQLQILESDDDISMRSIEGHIEERRRKFKYFIRRNVRMVVIVIVILIVLLIVITAILFIVLFEDARNK